MAVFRIEKTKDYTIVSNYHLRDRKLSIKGKGLLTLMLSLPADWDYTMKGLASIVPDGLTSVRSGVKELEDDGTNDVKLRLNLREYRYITAKLEPFKEAVSPAAAEPQRPDEGGVEGERIHNVVWGDTFWGICKTYYGDPLYYPQLASYNNWKNANLIYVGDVIRIPPKSVLDGMKG